MKKRDYGLDILRCLSMCSIVGLHILNNGALLHGTSLNTPQYIILLVIDVVMYASVNIFALMTGYLYASKKNIRKKRVLELIAITVFYGLIFTTILYVFFRDKVYNPSVLDFVQKVFPPLTGGFWYLTSYILLFILIPYINIFIESLTKRKFRNLLITLFFAFSITTIVLGYTDIFKINEGYSPFWLIYMYMIGAYIRIHGNRLFEIKKAKRLTVLVASIIAAVVLNVISKNIQVSSAGVINKGEWFIGYISPFTIINSILIFSLFKGVEIKNKISQKVIAIFSKTSFSVYIIHGQYLIYSVLLFNMFIPYAKSGMKVAVLSLLLGIMAIYLGCTAIDVLRIAIFKALGAIIRRFGST